MHGSYSYSLQMGGRFLCFALACLLAIVKQSGAAHEPSTPCILIITGLTSNIEDNEGPERIIDLSVGGPERIIDLSVGDSGGTLKLVHVMSKSGYAAVVSFVSNAFRHPTKDRGNNTSCSEVIGVIGDLDFKTASIIHTLASRSNLSITLVAAVAPSNFIPVTNLALPNLVDMRPLSHYIEGLVEFLDTLNWTRIGLVTDDTYYYQFAAELLQKRLLQDPRNTVTPFVRISDYEKLQVFKEYNTRIIIVLMDLVAACSTLKQAQKLHFRWPEYALILIDFGMSECSTEGMILLRENVKPSSSEWGCNGLCSFFFEEATQKSKNLPSIFYDSVLAVAAANGVNFTNTSFPGVNGAVKIRDNKRLSEFIFVQIINSSGQEVAYYNSQLQQLIMLPNTYLTTRTIPRGSTLIIVYQPSILHTVFVVVPYIFCTVFITVVFILYIYFRNEPEIKATSVIVSLCMFLGCYLLLQFVPVLLIEAHTIAYPQHLADFLCNLLAWLSVAGLPVTLILATLFVKMLRIYLIFFTPHTLKWKLFTNPFLFLYIVLLTSPSILILLLWSGSDALVNTQYEFHEKSRTVQIEKCLSHKILLWLVLQLIYVSVIAVALIILAVKTSDIRYKNFRDTKETNAFTFIAVYGTTLTVLYFCYFYLRGVTIFNIIAHSVALYIGHMFLPMACQIFLFVPKVYPPIKRRFCCCKCIKN